jgi:hypothetical protein
MSSLQIWKKMDLDPIVASAIIGFPGVVVGIGGYAFQDYYVKKSERETREYRIRRRRYDDFVKTITEGYHIVQTRNEKISPEFEKRMDEVTNVLYLHASSDVIRALKVLQDNWGPRQFQNLILATRNDLSMKPDLFASGIEWFRAT